jgi:hypothetical protein
MIGHPVISLEVMIGQRRKLLCFCLDILDRLYGLFRF